MDPAYLTIIVISLLFSALFSGSEIAFISANKLHIELQSKKGVLTGRILTSFLEHPSRFIGTTLLGNTLSLVVYGIFMVKLLEPWIAGLLPPAISNEGGILVIQTLISTFIVLVTAEFIPKSLFMINPNVMLRVIALPMRIIYFLLYPFVMAVVGLSKLLITRLFGLDYEESKPVYGLTDLNNFIKSFQKENPNPKIEVDTKILDNALEFKTVKIRECMIPRTELVAVDIEDSMEELKAAFVESGHSKILVYEDSIDNIIGYCHTLKLFKKPESIKEILTPVIILPETMQANDLMIQFITEHKSLALVVDEFGGTSGIVTMEDLIEEIFGEIQDEYDEENLVEQKIGGNTYLFSARLEIDYLNEKYNWNLPEGDYETLGGMILAITEDLPMKNQVITLPGFEIYIESVQNVRIDTIKLIRL